MIPYRTWPPAHTLKAINWVIRTISEQECAPIDADYAFLIRINPFLAGSSISATDFPSIVIKFPPTGKV